MGKEYMLVNLKYIEPAFNSVPAGMLQYRSRAFVLKLGLMAIKPWSPGWLLEACILKKSYCNNKKILLNV